MIISKVTDGFLNQLDVNIDIPTLVIRHILAMVKSSVYGVGMVKGWIQAGLLTSGQDSDG